MHADPALIRSIKSHVTREEWAARTDLAAAYRVVAIYGWDDLVFTHISAKVPGREPHFLINPYGMMFDEITASSLVKVDLEGCKVMQSPFEINPAGYTIHSAVHAARADAHCVLHLHTVDGVAVSCQKEGLLPILQQSLFALASLAYHDYEGVALKPEEKARLVSDLGDRHHMILRNHGLLTCAETVTDAFLSMYVLQKSCEVQSPRAGRRRRADRDRAPDPGGHQEGFQSGLARVGRHDRVAGTLAPARSARSFLANLAALAFGRRELFAPQREHEAPSAACLGPLELEVRK